MNALFVATVAILSCAGASAANGRVEGLLAKNFKGTLKNYDASLVEFYAPWCGHCKALEPKYAAAAAQLAKDHSDLNVALFKADAVDQQALTSKYGIQSYPTIKLFYGSKEIEKYAGDRETDALVQYLVDKVSTADPEEIAAARAKSKKKKKKKKKKSKPAAEDADASGDQAKKTKKAKKQARSGTKAKAAAADNAPKSAADLSKAEKAEKWREQIGRSTWHLLHSMAAKYPKNPTEEQKAAAVNMVQSLQALYPCEKCRIHLNEKMGTSKPLVSSRKAFSSWACMLHNLVNDDLDKERFDCSIKNLDEVYAKDCDGCVVDGSVEDLTANAVEFGANIAKDSPAPVAAEVNTVEASAGGIGQYTQAGDCSISSANEHHWLQADTERSSADLTDGKLTIVFFYAVTCHVCHEIHPVLKILHDEFAHRGLNIIGVHQSIYGDIEKKFESQAIDYHALEELPYPILSHQHTATKGEGDRTALPNSLFAMAMGRDGFGVPAMAVMKDCKTVWRGMGFQLKQINDWIRGHADQYLAPAHGEL